MIRVKKIAHATYEVPDVEKQTEYYTEILGLTQTGKDKDAVYLASTVDHHSVMLRKGSQAQCTRVGFQIGPDDDLGTFERQVQGHGIKTQRKKDPEPSVSDLLTFEDPKGTVCEVFVEQTPITPGRHSAAARAALERRTVHIRDPLADPACHIKANPNLGISIQREYLADQVSAAKNIPGETNTVLRLNFCVWTQQHTRAINMTEWRACEAPPPDEALVGVPCYGGLDLGMSDDFTAWVRLWTLDDGRVVVKCRFWLPRAALEKYPHRAYSQWQRLGLLTITEGSTTDYDVVEDTIAADCHADGVRSVAYDKRFAEQLAQHLIGDGIDMVDQPQGFQLTEAIRRKGELVAAHVLCHGGNAILAWMADNYVIRHGLRGDSRPDKEKAADKIDGQVALDMALALWVRQPKAAPPQYQMIIFGGQP